MPSLQAEFESEAAARRAMTSLTNAGVPEARMRLWNILPSREPHRSDEGATVRGAAIGGLLGGVLGLAAGAAAGAALDSSGSTSGREASVPAPCGVRLVVDTDPTGPDVACLLGAAGAANVHQTRE